MVGHVAVEFDATVDRTGVADDGVGLHELLALFGQAEKLVVFAQARERSALEAFTLDAQHVDDVELGESGVQVCGHMVGAEHVGAGRHERAGADQRDLCAHDLQRGEPESRIRGSVRCRQRCRP